MVEKEGNQEKEVGMSKREQNKSIAKPISFQSFKALFTLFLTTLHDAAYSFLPLFALLYCHSSPHTPLKSLFLTHFQILSSLISRFLLLLHHLLISFSSEISPNITLVYTGRVKLVTGFPGRGLPLNPPTLVLARSPCTKLSRDPKAPVLTIVRPAKPQPHHPSGPRAEEACTAGLPFSPLPAVWLGLSGYPLLRRGSRALRQAPLYRKGRDLNDVIQPPRKQVTLSLGAGCPPVGAGLLEKAGSGIAERQGPEVAIDSFNSSRWSSYYYFFFFTSLELLSAQFFSGVDSPRCVSFWPFCL